MNRYSLTSDGRGSCPTCAAHGIETATRDLAWSDQEGAIAVDDGCTEALIGVPCAECIAMGARSTWVDFSERYGEEGGAP